MCPLCGHPLEKHNDAGSFWGGEGEMCCYHQEPDAPQFNEQGIPNVCGCKYRAEDTRQFYAR